MELTQLIGKTPREIHSEITEFSETNEKACVLKLTSLLNSMAVRRPVPKVPRPEGTSSRRCPVPKAPRPEGTPSFSCPRRHFCAPRRHFCARRRHSRAGGNLLS